MAATHPVKVITMATVNLTYLAVLRNADGRLWPHEPQVDGSVLQRDGRQVAIVVRLKQEPEATSTGP